MRTQPSGLTSTRTEITNKDIIFKDNQGFSLIAKEVKYCPQDRVLTTYICLTIVAEFTELMALFL